MKYSILLASLMVGLMSCGDDSDKKEETEETGDKPVAGDTVVSNNGGGGMKLAFVKEDSVLINYKGAQAFQREMLTRQEEMATELKQLENRVMYYEREIQKLVASEVYAPSDIEDLQRKGEAAVANYQRKQMELQQQLEVEFGPKQQEQNEFVQAFINDYAEEHGYDMILLGSSIAYSKEIYNVSAEVLQQLNAAYDSGSGIAPDTPSVVSDSAR